MTNLRSASRKALLDTSGERVTSLVDALLIRLVELDSGREMRVDAQISQYETALRLFRSYGADVLSEALIGAMRKLTNTGAPEHYVEAACRGIYEDQHGGKQQRRRTTTPATPSKKPAKTPGTPATAPDQPVASTQKRRRPNPNIPDI
jgi:hypothetical protein